MIFRVRCAKAGHFWWTESYNQRFNFQRCKGCGAKRVKARTA
jgi:hypothetical protein